MHPVAFLTDDGIHATLGYDILLADISGIKPQVLSFVLLINERLNDIGVMYTGISGVVLLDELCLLVGLDVVLVAVVVLATLLCPASIDVLVAALVSLAILLLLGVALFCLPKAAAVAILDLLVLIMGFALAGASTKVASMILHSLNDKPRESRYDLNLSNRRSNVPVLPSLSRHAHTVFSSGTSATV